MTIWADLGKRMTRKRYSNPTRGRAPNRLSFSASLERLEDRHLLAGIISPAPTAFISAASVYDVEYDAKRDVVYIAAGSDVLRYDLADGNWLSPFQYGGAVGAMDISPNGDKLVVTGGGISGVHIVDLNTGTDQAYFYVPDRTPTGTNSAVFTTDDIVYVGASDGLRRLDLTTGDMTTKLITRSTRIGISADRFIVGYGESGSSPAPWGYINTTDDSVNRASFRIDFGVSEVAVSRDGSQFAFPSYGGTYVFDREFHQRAVIGTYANDRPFAVAYSPVSDLVYFAWTAKNGSQSVIEAYDTNTLRPVETVDGGYKYPLAPDAHPTTGVRMEVSDDGSQLFTFSADGVSVYSLTASAPILSGIMGASYVENSPAVTFEGQASIVDADSTSFTNGTFAVGITANAQAEDQLAIVNQGTEAGQIGTASTNVLYGGITIGTFSGGKGAVPLTVKLNAAATTEAIAALAQNITFQNTGDNPTNLPRTVTFQLADGAGGVSAPLDVNVQVTAINDPPQISSLSHSSTFQESSLPALFLPFVQPVVDPDSATFNGGQLTASLINVAEESDRLLFRSGGGITVSGNEVRYQNTVVGYVTGGVGLEPFTVTMTNAATSSVVRTMLSNLAFMNVSEGPTTATRDIAVQVTDGDGGSSPVLMASVTVMPVNDAPTLDTSKTPPLASIVEDGTPSPGTAIESLMEGFYDPDIGAMQGIGLVESDASSNGLWQYTLDGGTTWNDIGPLSFSSALLLPANGEESRLRFLPKPNFSGQVQLAYVGWDRTQGESGRTINILGTSAIGGTTAFSAQSRTTSLTITPVNDAPKLNTALSPTLTAINENNRNAWGTPVWTLLPGYSDMDAGALKGLAITSATGAANGAWQYTLDGGANWGELGAVSLSSAKLLPAQGNLSRVRFVPNANFHGTVQLGYFAWDQTQGEVGGTFDLSGSGKFGGTTAFSWGYETASLTVNPVNTPPVLTLPSAPVGYALNSPAVLLASTATVKDPDTVRFEGGWLKVEITAGADANDRLSIGGPFKVVEGNLIWNNQETIGTVQGGAGSEALLIQLNANATRYRVEQLVRSIKFGTVGSSQTGQRTVAFSVSDGTSDSNVATLDVQVA